MNKKKIILGAVIVSFSVMLSSFGFYFHQVVYAPNFLYEKNPKPLIIPTGSDFKYVQTELAKGGFLEDVISFSFLAKILDYDVNVKPGLYLIEPDMSNLQVIRMLRSGSQTAVNVTFNNVRLIPDLVEKITKNLEMSELDFEAVLRNDSLIGAYGFDSLTIISMFIPNTYQAYWNVKPEALFLKMNKEYEKFWTEERKAKAKEMGLNQIQVSVLASIVQSETIMSDERPIVAGLYLNRLERGIPLQADPTLVFAAQDFEIKRVLTKHTQIDSPFNTYKYQGLPPGPINMPSISSLDAVLNYQEHNFIYMCAKEDFSGYHNFATNLIDHNRNAVRYQQALNLAGLYK
ncbi:endolytic transglycosylase MltG [Reichenbachiella agarivorans]|uniref:Endolytic murein transglycosylase n=1 Tax=Reichenbachiella agarivorans TaxID=2979464 RepID=A0ABY6CUA3_9BACT|nr:endolytic transglycosylase MltG [Reichenbachiella agarivorans]UXP34097.1 endolytic transglycosylase MltG [Reichenbachiella agarivorans]